MYLKLTPAGTAVQRLKVRIECKGQLWAISPYPEVGSQQPRVERDQVRRASVTKADGAAVTQE